MAEFSDTVVEQAWQRSGGNCECTRTTHGHTGRCNKMITKGRRGDRGNIFYWEVRSISGLYKDSASDCQILCRECHYATS